MVSRLERLYLVYCWKFFEYLMERWDFRRFILKRYRKPLISALAVAVIGDPFHIFTPHAELSRTHLLVDGLAHGIGIGAFFMVLVWFVWMDRLDRQARS